MPKLLPVGGRGPYAVGIATEHVRTPSSGASTDEKDAQEKESELWPLELMAQVMVDTLLPESLKTRHIVVLSTRVRITLVSAVDLLVHKLVL